ncbi:MAG TPA: M23 family metallopeptidase [bacterium]|nr:M23 family metallopeptidase [bacterium]
MIKERFRVMYLPKNGADIKHFSFDGKRFFISSAILVLSLFFIATFTIGTFTRVFQNYRIISLTNDRAKLRQELLAIKSMVAGLNDRLAQLESTGDELRNVAALQPIDKDIREVGIGGGSFEFGYYPDEISRTAGEIKLDLDKIERAVNLEKSSLREITAALQEQQDLWSRFPSIRPIVGGVIRDPFGFRVHPLTGKVQEHRGVDIPSREGTRVLATADGVVKIAKSNYRTNKSYGQYIVIDHGYEYETLYAHLSKIYVRPGEKVRRWQAIGEVGQTGATTGPHLHYEVAYNGRVLDPELFIVN